MRVAWCNFSLLHFVARFSSDFHTLHCRDSNSVQQICYSAGAAIPPSMLPWNCEQRVSEAAFGGSSTMKLPGSRLLIAAAMAHLASPVAQAQDKNALKTDAKAAIAQMQKLGEPMSRCSISAYIEQGPIVRRTFASTPLRPGDELLTLNNVNVAGKSAEDVVALLRGIAPGTVIPVTLERNGEPMRLDLTCSDARPVTEAAVGYLKAVSLGKFDDCVSAIRQRSDMGSGGAATMLQCAAVSKNAANYNIAQLTFDFMRMFIEDAHWVPALRGEAIQSLRSSEATISQNLGSSRFEELVSATKAWPGGERMFDATAPNWGLFRRNAEAALRARLIDPESARIEWPYGFVLGSWKPVLSKRINGYWTCGSINARNRMGGYTGSSSFVVVLDPVGNVLHTEMGQSRDFDLISAQCSQAVKLLPPPQFDTSKPIQTTQGSSLADELRKLVELRESGALSEEEFQQAKRRLLGSTN
ncbi:SHOCT domain-containing protein [Novosphingobium sp. TH158]|uniref:SHOCT domain-containing protein n=1 Tax=Novosphingobium sp. TH158 TaxID=2067455 RepID=UPI001C1FB47E|nr:SHOCT domain-containing protein [Novosphingobium sp. TH158]